MFTVTVVVSLKRLQYNGAHHSQVLAARRNETQMCIYKR